MNEEALAHWGLSRQKQTKSIDGGGVGGFSSTVGLIAVNNEGYIKEGEANGEGSTHPEKKKDVQGPGMEVQTSWKTST